MPTPPPMEILPEKGIDAELCVWDRICCVRKEIQFFALSCLATTPARVNQPVMKKSPPAIGLARARGESAGDRLEGESLAFHEKVNAGFLALAKREAHRIRLLPAGEIEDIHAEVLRIISETFGWNGKNSSVKTPQ